MGRKEDNIAKAKNLMNKLSRIRNIGVAAHIDHGKCVSGESLISLSNGENIKAEDLFERYKNQGQIVKDEKDEKVVKVKNIPVTSFCKKNKKITNGKITHIWKLKKTNSLVKIKF